MAKLQKCKNKNKHFKPKTPDKNKYVLTKTDMYRKNRHVHCTLCRHTHLYRQQKTCTDNNQHLQDKKSRHLQKKQTCTVNKLEKDIDYKQTKT